MKPASYQIYPPNIRLQLRPKNGPQLIPLCPVRFDVYGCAACYWRSSILVMLTSTVESFSNTFCVKFLVVSAGWKYPLWTKYHCSIDRMVTSNCCPEMSYVGATCRHTGSTLHNHEGYVSGRPAYSYGGSHCCVSPLELYTICIILPSLYAILVATLFAFLHHRGELRISPYLWGENPDSNSRCI